MIKRILAVKQVHYCRGDVMLMDRKAFWIDNLKVKSEKLQEEHIMVLQYLYDNAVELGVVKDFEFNENLIQSVKYTKIEEAVGMDSLTLNLCLHDLMNLGFIMNTMRNPYKEEEYGIWYLGLKYFESLKDK